MNTDRAYRKSDSMAKRSYKSGKSITFRAKESSMDMLISPFKLSFNYFRDLLKLLAILNQSLATAATFPIELKKSL